MNSEGKERRKAVNRERAAAYKKRKKELLQESHVNLSSVHAEASATLPIQPAKKRDGRAEAAQSITGLAVLSVLCTHLQENRMSTKQ